MTFESHSQQLVLPFRLNEQFTFENFNVSANPVAIHHLQNKLHPENEWFYCIWGANGTGRSHLLQAICQDAINKKKSSIYLPLKESADQIQPEILDNLETYDLICLDDIDTFFGIASWEQKLFQLFNLCQLNHTKLIVSAAVSPMAMHINLADLQSRLNHGLTFQLQTLTDEQKIIALQLRATQEGMTLPNDCANYLLTHTKRDTKQLFSLLERLTHATLQQKRKLTIPFIKTILSI